MSRIRSRDTKPEKLVRSLLHRLGYRFRLGTRITIPKDEAAGHAKLSIRPDIVLPKHRAVVFVHGCFWHRHQGCRDTTTPKSRTEWWQEKFATNVSRDRRNQAALEKAGWNVLVVWECETATRSLPEIAQRLDRSIRKITVYDFSGEANEPALKVAEDTSESR